MPDFEKFATDILEKKTPKKNNNKKNGNDIFSITKKYLLGKYELRRNTLSFEVEITPKNAKDWKIVSFDDLFIELKGAGINIKENFLKIILRSSFVPEFNPFLAYFESLDNLYSHQTEEKNYIEEFCTYIDADASFEDLYNSITKMLIRSIACSLGQQFNKQCFVFVSPHQNIGKTSLIKWLCPEPLKKYYTEEMSFDKDGLIALATNFMINLDELSTLAKAEINTLKAYFSKDTIKVRLPYEAKATSVKRVANFFASTNNEDFLNDPTGSVRWVAFYIHSINFAYSEKIDPNLLWWQAYQLYKQGVSGKLTQKEVEINETRNLQFTKITSEIELLQRFCEPADNEFLGEFLTVSEIQERLSQLSTTKISNVVLGRALQSLKYKRVSRRKEKTGFPVYGFYVIFKK